MDQQQTEQLRYLFSTYSNNLSTKAEYEAFLQFVNAAENDEELKSLLAQLFEELEEKQEKHQIAFAQRPFVSY